MPNVMRIAGVFRKYYKNIFGLFFWTPCSIAV